MVTVELLLKTLMKIYCDPNMTVELINSGGDHRGKILFFKSENLKEKFFSGKSRAFYGTHLSTGDKMFSNLHYLRSLTTITWDTLDWYGYDEDGSSVHDVIGTRCDPYTEKLINTHIHINIIQQVVLSLSITTTYIRI